LLRFASARPCASFLKTIGFSCEASAVFGRESERTLFSVKKGSLYYVQKSTSCFFCYRIA
jgi:hypothetical protein